MQYATTTTIQRPKQQQEASINKTFRGVMKTLAPTTSNMEKATGMKKVDRTNDLYERRMC